MTKRKEIDALWAKEAEVRVRAFSLGQIKTKSTRQIFRALQRRNINVEGR